MLSFLVPFVLEYKVVIEEVFFFSALKVNLWYALCLSCPLAHPVEASSRKSAALNGSRKTRCPGFSSFIKGRFYSVFGTN